MRNHPLPRKFYLVVHDALKKVNADCSVSAFVSDRRKFQSDMGCNFKVSEYQSGEEFTRDFALKLQQYIPHAHLVARRQRIDVEFPFAKEEMTIQLGMQGVTIDDVNAEPEHEYRIALRSSLGFDEELFLKSAPAHASVAAVMLEKWVYDLFTEDFRPHVVYWLAHCYCLMEAMPSYRHHQLAVGYIQNRFHKYNEPFPNPYCPGEDMNTMRKVKNLCARVVPGWDGSFVEAVPMEGITLSEKEPGVKPPEKNTAK